MDKPVTPPSTAAPRNLPSYAWWLVLGLVGLDCFSTLAYLPTIAVEGAQRMAPVAAAGVGVLILFIALPVYLYVVGRSPHGRGATGLLESHFRGGYETTGLLERRFSGWRGKAFVLVLLGFVATDFVMTRAVSTADASKHLIYNPHAQAGLNWLGEQKESLQLSLHDRFQSETVDRFLGWWDDQLIVAVILIVLGFAFYFFLLRGFTRSFLYAATAIVTVFLAVNIVVIVSGLLYVFREPAYLSNWWEKITFASRSGDPLMLFLDLAGSAIYYLPALVLGLSGFELSMTSAPLVQGQLGDDPERPRGRIRNTRKVLVTTAVLMAVLVPASVLTVTLLVPEGLMAEDGEARHRALSYIAHGGGNLQAPGARFGTDNPAGKTAESPDDDEPPPPPAEGEEPAAPVPHVHRAAPPTGADLNPVFGPAFGTLYDVSAILILCLAGASVTISLRDLLPEYLTRYGMEMRWAHRIGVLLHLFNLILLVVVIAFRASVAHQQGAYATSVLVLLAGAVLAASIDLRARWPRSVFLPLLTTPLLLICFFSLGLAAAVCRQNPAGAIIALLFIVTVFVTAGLSRWMRSTELRYEGFTYADEETGVRWEEIRRLEFQVLVPHRADHLTLADKDAEIRARHRLGPDVPIIFIEAELGDPSDFQNQPLMRIVKENGFEVIRVSQCASIAHVLAAIALEFRDVGRPPEIHFAWSEESPLASNLNFLLWGEGNIPWMVHALIRKTERDPARRPRVVIG